MLEEFWREYIVPLTLNEEDTTPSTRVLSLPPEDEVDLFPVPKRATAIPTFAQEHHFQVSDALDPLPLIPALREVQVVVENVMNLHLGGFFFSEKRIHPNTTESLPSFLNSQQDDLFDKDKGVRTHISCDIQHTTPFSPVKNLVFEYQETRTKKKKSTTLKREGVDKTYSTFLDNYPFYIHEPVDVSQMCFYVSVTSRRVLEKESMKECLDWYRCSSLNGKQFSAVLRQGVKTLLLPLVTKNEAVEEKKQKLDLTRKKSVGFGESGAIGGARKAESGTCGQANENSKHEEEYEVFQVWCCERGWMVNEDSSIEKRPAFSTMKHAKVRRKMLVGEAFFPLKWLKKRLSEGESAEEVSLPKNEEPFPEEIASIDILSTNQDRKRYSFTLPIFRVLQGRSFDWDGQSIGDIQISLS